MDKIAYEDFEKVDMRVGRILEAEELKGARKPSYKLKIDFGKEMGIKTSSAQITALYKKEELVGRLVLAVVNFHPKMIANFKSEVLTLGVKNPDGHVALLCLDKETELGERVF